MTQSLPKSWLDDEFTQLVVVVNGVAQPFHSKVQFVAGRGVLLTATEDAGNDQNIIRADAQLGTVDDSTTTGPTNDYALPDLASWLRFSHAGGATITGFANGVNGRELVVTAVGVTVNLDHANTGSVAANRILCGAAAANIALPDGKSARLAYDGTAQRWRVLSVSP